MDFEEDGSETGSAVSDEDLELDDEEAQQHDVSLSSDRSCAQANETDGIDTRGRRGRLR